MPIAELTPDLIYVAGHDAGNRSMRKAGRTAWNEDDWDARHVRRVRPPERRHPAQRRHRGIAMNAQEHIDAGACLFIAAIASGVGYLWSQPDLLWFAGALLFACFVVWLTEPVKPDTQPFWKVKP